MLALISSAFWLAGTFQGPAPWYFSSDGAYLGMVILLTVVPAYFAIAAVYGIRRSLQLAKQVDELNNTNLSKTVASIPLPVITGFALLGVFYALVFNVPGHGLDFFEVSTVDKSMILGQVFIWTVCGLLLGTRFHIIRAFHRISRQAEINLFETSNLKPFAQVGLIDALVIAGALVLSTVQSLDFSFRPDNYTKALFVAVPSVVYLCLYPMWDIHNRMAAIKADQLNELAKRIRESPSDLVASDMNELEILLQRRERVAAAPTWPIDITILQRFLFYIIIPPLAWVGAAIVEYLIEGIIRG